MNTNSKIAAAIAAILGSAATAGSAMAAPTPTAAAAPDVPLYIAGSSAAAKGVLSALEADMCKNTTYYLFESTGNANFFAVSCVPPANTTLGSNGSDVYTVWYRDEGGSVVGALPIVTGYSPKQLNLAAIAASCPAASPCIPTLAGSSTGNGIDDSFTPAASFFSKPVQLGILDVEPSIFGLATKNNYPTAYSNTIWNPSNIAIPTVLASLTGLSSGQLFDEVYGIFVDAAGLLNNGAAVTAGNPLALSKAMVANILDGAITDWSLVTDTNGKAVSSSPFTITIVNRETGSGSRAATDLLITGDSCASKGKVLAEQLPVTKQGNPNVDYFATGDVLGAASTIPGSITYATIDQTKTNMSLVSLNGIVPGNAAAAAGQYDFWVEASYVINASQASSFTTAQTNLVSFLTTDLQNVATAPHLPDVLAIPGQGTNTATVALVASTAGPILGGSTIYINPFTRAGVTCNVPTYLP